MKQTGQVRVGTMLLLAPLLVDEDVPYIQNNNNKTLERNENKNKELIKYP